MLIDCHVHLDRYSDAEIAPILQRAQAAGVRAVISAGTTLESSLKCIQLASTSSPLFAGVGIHPLRVSEPIDDTTYGQLREAVLSSERVVVVSETGLDFTDSAPRPELQYQAFRQQIRLAGELGLPLVFHTVEAHQETLRILVEEGAGQVGGVMHYFQADEYTARSYIDAGFYISLAKPLLRLPHLQELAARLPIEHILLESDSSPQPYKPNREDWTEPRHVRDVAQRLAELRGMPVKEVEEKTTGNLLRLLGPRAKALQTLTNPAFS